MAQYHTQGRIRVAFFGALLGLAALGAAACSPASTATPAAPAAPATPAATVAAKPSGEVTAGAKIGAAAVAPAGWMPPAHITPVNPPPGMFKSVGEAPAQPEAKVRVFFLGMQW